MRRALDALYTATALLGALFIVAIGVLMSAQVLGRELGIQVKGADDLTAWSVVAAGFLPLAHTYRHGGHIRVTLLIDKARGPLRRALELAVLITALFFVGFLTWSGFDMVRDSIRFDDLSQGLITIPIWIPQISIPIGTLILTIAIFDDILTTVFGGAPSYLNDAKQNDLSQTHMD
jgi:TRAP-type C4-dicarboxylate transport system permease small subunit